MAQPAPPGATYDPRNPRHVLVGPGHPLAALKGRSVTDVRYLVSLAAARRDPRRYARMTKTPTAYAVRRAAEAEPALDFLARLPAAALFFAATRGEAEAYARLASAVRKDELDFLVKHTIGAQEGTTEAVAARREARELDALARRMDGLYRRFAADGLLAASQIDRVEREVGMSLAQVKQRARALHDRAETLEATLYREAAEAVRRGRQADRTRHAGGAQVGTLTAEEHRGFRARLAADLARGGGLVQGDPTGEVRKIVRDLTATAEGFGRAAGDARKAADKIDRQFAHWQKRARADDHAQFLAWVRAEPPQYVANTLGITPAEVAMLKGTDYLARAADLRARAVALEADAAAWHGRARQAAEVGARATTVYERFSYEVAPGVRAVDQVAVDRFYARQAALLLGDRRKADGSRKMAWDAVGVTLSDQAAAGMGVHAFTPPGAHQTLVLRRLDPHAQSEAIAWAADQERMKVPSRAGFKAPPLSPAVRAAAGIRTRLTTGVDAKGRRVTYREFAGFTSVVAFARPGVVTLHRDAPSHTYGGQRPGLVTPADRQRGPLIAKTEPGYRPARTEVYHVQRAIDVTVTAGTFRTTGLGTPSRVWDKKVGLDPRTGLPATWFETRTVWSAGVSAAGRSQTTTRVPYLETRLHTIPGRPAERLLARFDGKSVLLAADLDDFRDAMGPRINTYRVSAPVPTRKTLPQPWLGTGPGGKPRLSADTVDRILTSRDRNSRTAYRWDPVVRSGQRFTLSELRRLATRTRVGPTTGRMYQEVTTEDMRADMTRDQRWEALERRAARRFYGREDHRDYHGHGSSASYRFEREALVEADWRRRTARSVPEGLREVGLRWNDPGFRSSPLFRAFGQDLGAHARYRTVAEAVRSDDVQAVRAFGPRGRRNRIEFSGGDGASYQVLPDGRLRRVTTGPWRAFLGLKAKIASAKSPEQLPELAREVFRVFHPKGIKGAREATELGKDANFFGAASGGMEHPAVVELLRDLRKQDRLLSGSGGGVLGALGVGGLVGMANYAAWLTRADQTAEWADLVEGMRLRRGKAMRALFGGYLDSSGLFVPSSGMEGLRSDWEGTTFGRIERAELGLKSDRRWVSMARFNAKMRDR